MPMDSIFEPEPELTDPQAQAMADMANTQGPDIDGNAYTAARVKIIHQGSDKERKKRLLRLIALAALAV